MSESRDGPSQRPGVPVPSRGRIGGGDAGPRPVPEAEVFVFRTVRQSGGGRQLPWGSAHLTLVFDEQGVEISGSRPGERSVIPWAAVTRVSRGASERAPDGGSVTIIGIESPGRIMRFVVTSHRRDPIELAALSEQVQRWSDSAGSEAAGLAAAGSEEAGRVAVGSPPSEALPPSVPSLSGPPTGPLAAADPAVVVPARLEQFQAASTELPESTESSGGGPEPRPAGIAPMAPVAPRVRAGPPPRPRRRRRTAMLLVGLAFLASGVGLAIALSSPGPSRPSAGTATARPSPDQALADRLMLSRNDLPSGWRVSSGMAGAGNSPRVQTGESAIAKTFARCMGISQSRASEALGGGAPDQTAGTTSPVFLAPTPPDSSGFALELQTAANIVRSHQDEQRAFALFGDPRYPQCAGNAVASETQLGADSSSGANQLPGPASVSPVDVAAPPGEQAAGWLVSFTISDRSASVPVEVETVSLGDNRIEASLQALAIGGQIPDGVLTSSISAFEQRVDTGGRSAQV